MFSFILRRSFPRLPRRRAFPLGVLWAAAPLLTLPARAETSAPTVTATSVSPEIPSLTEAPRPASAISDARRAAPTNLPERVSPVLVMAVPDEPTSKTPVSKVPTPNEPPKTTQNTAKITALTSAPRAEAPSTRVAITSTAPTPATVPSTMVAGPREPEARFSARLPARGGPILQPAPVELAPDNYSENTDDAPQISDSQRLLLARLDADLAREQKRLNRAESRLSEGQKQLGAATGLLQNAILEAGDDGRGLHPFVRVAQRYLGTPYVWGGESAQGFDCSGFIMRVMRDLGYRALPHSAAEQFRYGLPVAKPLLKPGDIVFFANTYKPGISHVGIYLGRGRFIHAANSHVGTIVSNLGEPKWVEKYAGARRLLPLNS